MSVLVVCLVASSTAASTAFAQTAPQPDASVQVRLSPPPGQSFYAKQGKRWTKLCDGACELRFLPGDYQLGVGSDAGSVVSAAHVAHIEREGTIEGEVISHHKQRATSHVLWITGGLVALVPTILGAVLIAHANDGSCNDEDGNCGYNGLQRLGGIGAIVGGVVVFGAFALAAVSLDKPDELRLKQTAKSLAQRGVRWSFASRGLGVAASW